eukprot:Phypoly_transcript_02447.p1 GENE.Phypoly_transcript_02447~~Phypoly_transcript_02447.p1  ORF type:complete len:756 (+),score=77.56 Phypoly_transcript_02447:1-2268(+)
MGNTMIYLKSNYSYCHCVDISNDIPSSPSPNLSGTCVHDELFREVYRELSSCKSSFTMLQLKEHMTSCFQRRNQHALQERLEKMRSKGWRSMLGTHFKLVYADNKLAENIVVTIPDTVCSCLAKNGIIASPQTPNQNEPSSLSSAANPSSLSSSLSSTPVLATATSLTPSISPPAPTASTKSNFNAESTSPALPSFMQKSGSHWFALIEKFKHLREAIQFIRACPKLAVDCEGVALSKTGKLCLIQVSATSAKGDQYTIIFDIVCLEKLPEFKEVCDSLASFLQDPNILKVMHDARQDCSALFHQMSITVNNIFDTQIAYRMICEIKRGTSTYSADECGRIGLNPLLQKYGFPPHPTKDQIHARMHKTGSDFWKIRPLAKDLIEYMIEDVVTLLPLSEKMAEDFQIWSLQSVKELSYKYSRRHIDDPKSTPTPNCLLELTFTPDFQHLYREVDPHEPTDISDNDDFMLDEDTLSLTSLLPSRIRARAIQKSVEVKRNLIEVVMDHERPVSLRFSDIDDVHLKEEANITDALQSLSDGIAKITGSAKPIDFMSDNRLGISKMLHRISALKSRYGEIIGLTYRVGRSVEGVSHMIQDIVAKVAGYDGKKPSSVLFLGRPGVGKTTVLREVSRLLAGDQFKRRVVVVDTSNEIAGDGDTPHPCIGRARRVQVPHRNEQHSIMIETVQNHNPQVIVVDEIGTTQEVEAAKTIAQRGVAMVGTAHGEDLHTLLKNPTLRGLIGGVQQVILSYKQIFLVNF